MRNEISIHKIHRFLKGTSIPLKEVLLRHFAVQREQREARDPVGVHKGPHEAAGEVEGALASGEDLDHAVTRCDAARQDLFNGQLVFK
jgi:hypothetical protein